MFKSVHFCSFGCKGSIKNPVKIADPWKYKELLNRIEAMFEHGPGANWTNQDFSQLSDNIYNTTGKRLSITTLKRIWGRAETKTNPSLTTLNILSEFAQYQGWREFSLSVNISERRQIKNGRREIFTKRSIIIGTAFISIVFLLLLTFTSSEKNGSSPTDYMQEDIVFVLDKVASGYPNTVIFEYDVGELSYDSLFIQQSWDENKRTSLKKRKGLVTTTYYYPGYFLAKLVVDSTTIKEEELYIPTKGWQGMLIGESSEFTYLRPDDILLDGKLHIGPGIFEQMNRAKPSEMFLSYLAERPEINGSDFAVETEFRMPDPTERSICKNIRLTVTGTKEVLSFQFGIPGCVGDLMFFLNKEMISGRDNDLSAFGIETDDWTKCKVKVKDDQVKVFLNGMLVYTYSLQSDIGKIGGVQWMFQGLAEIRALDIYDSANRMDLIGG
jgi:hypothetical protein